MPTYCNRHPYVPADRAVNEPITEHLNVVFTSSRGRDDVGTIDKGRNVTCYLRGPGSSLIYHRKRTPNSSTLPPAVHTRLVLRGRE